MITVYIYLKIYLVITIYIYLLRFIQIFSEFMKIVSVSKYGPNCYIYI